LICYKYPNDKQYKIAVSVPNCLKSVSSVLIFLQLSYVVLPSDVSIFLLVVMHVHMRTVLHLWIAQRRCRTLNRTFQSSILAG